jgi:hypothetical protein
MRARPRRPLCVMADIAGILARIMHEA